MKELPYSLLLFELCSKFHCLPSQLEQEENRIIEEFLVIMDEVNTQEAKELKKAQRMSKRG